jgi:uncharacterized protein (DUF488 family)
MLYSIGYQKFKSAEEMVIVLKHHKVTHLVDVRSRPYSRKKEFNKNRLKNVEGLKYIWMGDCLGGFADIDEKDIQSLEVWQKERIGCLMCMEADPDQCHRKTEISKRLEKYNVQVTHIK